MQVVHRSAKLDVEYLDLSALTVRAAEEKVSAVLQAELDAGFAMNQAPLLRVRLVKWPGDRHRIIESHHHILMDAWCRSTLFLDFFDFYRSFETGAPTERRTPRRYRDFIAWLSTQRSSACQGVLA